MNTKSQHIYNSAHLIAKIEFLFDSGGYADYAVNVSRAAGYASQIAVEVTRLGRLVSNMLDLSRLERGASLASPQPGDAAAAVRTALDRLTPALAAEGVEVLTEIDGELPAVQVDPDAVDQILANLLDNAEKYTRDAADRRVEVSVHAAAGGVEVAVRDHGPGIPRALRHRLFRPYTRAAEDAVPGLGLGLPLARALAEAMGGNLTLDDATADGAAFRLTLPPPRTSITT